MALPLSSASEDIMFLGCHTCSFVRSDTVTAISHDWLEQFFEFF